LSQALLARFEGDIRRLYQAHPSELARVKGINQATAIRIKAALNLGLRLSMPGDERTAINSPADAAAQGHAPGRFAPQGPLLGVFKFILE
ncbi:MAG TPA: hypothetical protein VF498_07710, partial [Anaerolineales bacterium]